MDIISQDWQQNIVACLNNNNNITGLSAKSTMSYSDNHHTKHTHTNMGHCFITDQELGWFASSKLTPSVTLLFVSLCK